MKRLHAAGYSAFWVGGCVRDVLLGREPQDYDIVTSALPEQIEALFQKTISVGRKFGVIVVVEGDLQIIEMPIYPGRGELREAAE